MRKPIIAGNWKMNNTPTQAKELVEALIPLVKDNNEVDVVVCPTYVCLQTVADLVKGTNVKLGAQNIHFEKSGAYTGEISADMLLSVGCEYVIIGHSERREYFNETDESVNKKVLTAFENGLTPILCVGETLSQREEGITKQLVKDQTVAAFKGLCECDAKKVVIAYEPIWAIGTGKVATPEDAEDVIATIRDAVCSIYSCEVADAVRIQHGGSMKPTSCDGLMAKPNIDGGLIGGASLVADDFARIINFK